MAGAAEAISHATMIEMDDYTRTSAWQSAEAAYAMAGLGPSEMELAMIYDSRSEEHTSELQSLMRISYAVFCLKKKKNTTKYQTYNSKPTTNQAIKNNKLTGN